MKEATRQMINGIHVLRYPDHSLYVDVAERVRLVHRSNTSFSVERGEICHIKHIWFYRATITVGEQQYIGDAEIHFGAPVDTPDGTNPVSCGQTSALGNALTFAGFGDLRTLLERQGDLPDDDAGERSPDSPSQVIQGIEVVLLDGVPYVPVAERIRQVYRTGTSFAIESCSIHEANGVWMYRAVVLVNGKRFVGDAEIFFDAPPETIDGKYPLSCGQTSAVGNALAFAGFGDVQSILERQGKSSDDRSLTPRLASADAVLRAKQAAAGRLGKPLSVPQRNGSIPKTATSSREAEGGKGQATRPKPITSTQREQVRLLCERLGETEPATINEMTEKDAEFLVARLQSQEAELFQTIDEALLEEHAETEPQTEAYEGASYSEIGMLKTAWMRAYHVKGAAADVRQTWRQFKQRVCHREVSDDTMTREQYQQLMSAVERHQQKEAQPHVNAPTGRTE
jgi:hypothetical protein